ncbi:MAG: hypothetical protein ABF542_12510 [Gluconobacter sp.]
MTVSVGRVRAGLMRESSIELLPSRILELSGVLPDLAGGSRVFVTWLPGVPFADVLAACDLLKLCGYLPVPHVAARSIRDKDHLQEICTALSERDIPRMLLIAGGAEKPAGIFADTVQVWKQRSLFARAFALSTLRGILKGTRKPLRQHCWSICAANRILHGRRV